MKTKALASYHQLILATQRGSYYGPVPCFIDLCIQSALTHPPSLTLRATCVAVNNPGECLRNTNSTTEMLC